MLVADANLLWEATDLGRQGPIAHALTQRDPLWAAPRFWESEVRNICATAMRTKKLTLSRAIEVMDQLPAYLRGGVRIPETPRVLELAQASGHSAYDCEYVAVAESLGVPLVTFDQALIRAFPAVAISPQDFLARPG